MGVHSRDKLYIIQKEEIYFTGLSIIILGERDTLLTNKTVSPTISQKNKFILPEQL